MTLHSRRPALGRLASFLLCIAVIGGCRESTTGTPATNAAESSSLAGASPLAVQKRARVHSANRFDWIGAAHNRTIDDFRKQMRMPGLLTRNFCEFAVDFSTRTDRVRDSLVITETQLRAARSAAFEVTCGRRSGLGGLAALRRFLGFRRAPRQDMTATASQLLAEIDQAVDASRSSFELAPRLEDILRSSAALDTVEQALVSVAASVAQNSYEYWETNYSSFQSEFSDEYTPCASTLTDEGYSLDDAARRCMEGGATSLDVVRAHPTRPYVQPRSVAARGAPACEPDAAWRGVVRTAKADKNGAVAGFFGALGSTRDIRAALLGALGGAAANSLKEAGIVTWEIIKCAYQI